MKNISIRRPLAAGALLAVCAGAALAAGPKEQLHGTYIREEFYKELKRSHSHAAALKALPPDAQKGLELTIDPEYKELKLGSLRCPLQKVTYAGEVFKLEPAPAPPPGCAALASARELKRNGTVVDEIELGGKRWVRFQWPRWYEVLLGGPWQDSQGRVYSFATPEKGCVWGDEKGICMLYYRENPERVAFKKEGGGEESWCYQRSGDQLKLGRLTEFNKGGKCPEGVTLKPKA